MSNASNDDESKENMSVENPVPPMDHPAIPKDEKTLILEKIENLTATIKNYMEDFTMKSSSSKKFPEFSVKLNCVNKFVNTDTDKIEVPEEPKEEEEKEGEGEEVKTKKKKKEKEKKSKPKKEQEIGESIYILI